ncbi:inositol polyphosphate-5-phosphatase A isoform X1 [Erinaceus europaeus]|uniref:inositol-polyphosphate 5-phosphatase n=2 Tax=Erinaceus europaeus TaxID=9365 RepID=A0ABM3VRV8_ERIEU|nr:inositol polyphosphate-5-phosphatase A isoform X1 [Erinaceus europaeus]
MAGRAAAPGAALLLVTANVGSLFDDPENLQNNWLHEFYQVVHAHTPHFMALHCQEFGGKNYEASMAHVDKFVKELLSSDAMKEYNRARVYLDENYRSQEHFTALGSFYFLHESLKNIYQFDFQAKKYRKVTGKEIYSDTLESTPMLEKEKFPQHYFPECKWSRKGFLRTRWCIADCAFDLVNIHLFHDASNLVAWESSPSLYSGIRHKALGYVLDRIMDQRFEKVAYFVFGDFNFRLDAKSVVETLCTKATMQTVRAADSSEVVKLIFREADNDHKVLLQLEKKLFDYINQEVFHDNNGTALLEFDKELAMFRDQLQELDINFPPSYPYSEDRSRGRQYMNTRCPAWCDRVLMSPAAKELVLRAESEGELATYDHIGPDVCMGDHKPVFLAFHLAPGAVRGAATEGPRDRQTDGQTLLHRVVLGVCLGGPQPFCPSSSLPAVPTLRSLPTARHGSLAAGTAVPSASEH